MSDDPDGFYPGAAPLCVFCSAPWTNEMVKVLNDTKNYESCGWSHITLTITCESCDRPIYSKEIVDENW